MLGPEPAAKPDISVELGAGFLGIEGGRWGDRGVRLEPSRPGFPKTLGLAWGVRWVSGHGPVPLMGGRANLSRSAVE